MEDCWKIKNVVGLNVMESLEKIIEYSLIGNDKINFEKYKFATDYQANLNFEKYKFAW